MKHRYPGTGCKEIVPNRDLRYPSTRHGDGGEIQAASVRHVLGPDARGEDIRAAAFARWLAGEVGEGALAPTTRRSASRESREELREAWRVLCAALPKAWIVKTPVDCQQAIVELATDGVIGEGLFPVPIGRRPGEPTPAPEFDQERLDGALSTLGRRLETGGESERLRHSRLLLSETLLSIRPHCPMDDHLFALPLLRAIGLPEDREEAWSITELHCQIENRRVFASPASEAQDYDGADGTQPERSSDPKRATTELAIALDETVWLVNGDAVASVADDVPSPAPETLASAVLRAGAFAEPADRALLLHRLAPNISDGADLCLAARMLLPGVQPMLSGGTRSCFMLAPEARTRCSSYCACSTGRGAQLTGRWWSRFRKTSWKSFPSVRSISKYYIAYSMTVSINSWTGQRSATGRPWIYFGTCTAWTQRLNDAGAGYRCTGASTEVAGRSTTAHDVRPKGLPNFRCRRNSVRMCDSSIRSPSLPVSTTPFLKSTVTAFSNSCWRTRAPGVSPNGSCKPFVPTMDKYPSPGLLIYANY